MEEERKSTDHCLGLAWKKKFFLIAYFFEHVAKYDILFISLLLKHWHGRFKP